MSTDSQRKAWNEAMRSAGGILPASSMASGPTFSTRRIVGRKRRAKARQSSAGYGVGGGVGGGGWGGSSSSLEEREYRVALHMDLLEGSTAAPKEDDDDEYDEFAQLDDDDIDDDDDDDEIDGGDRGKSKKKRRRRAVPGGGIAAGRKSGPSVVPKYLRPRSLASILMEEASRPDSVAGRYVDASVRRLGSGTQTTRVVRGGADAGIENAVVVTTITRPYPARKFCPVTGLPGVYTEPRTGIPYATLSALEQIRERPPPWMSSTNAGSASYWEAIKSLQNH
ncbi:hypothetical protein ACHAXA_003993 [Cyclostephanos tholiformis]|uniref:Vps72/YL1 C-terminal domain-containing protein n=1 Tax=Cyclostephanos tholiformis TaxID=382380 RepID=A0ABD3R8S6_9STRA